MLDNKADHKKAYMRYKVIPISVLEGELKEMYHKRFVEHDIEYAELYRIASLVYNRRTRNGTGLVFHMNKFVGR